MNQVKLPGYLFSAIAIIFALLLSSNRISPVGDQLALATVQQIQGKYVFVMCQPVQEYEEVDKVNTAFSDLADLDKSAYQSAKEMVKKGIRKEKNGKIDSFDGVITKDGMVGTLIKFK